MEDGAMKSQMLRKSKHIVSRVIGDETVLLPMYKNSDEINCIYTLNKAAAWIWDNIDGKTTVEQLFCRASQEFDAAEAEANRKLLKVLGELKSIKAVI
jgi:hypothetical protein